MSSLLKLFSPLPRSSFAALATVGLLLIVGLWLALSFFQIVPSLFLPRPEDVLDQLRWGPSWKVWLVDLGMSSGRILGGFLLAAILGIPVGLYKGADTRIDALAFPVIEVGRYVPVPALLPLCILWFGIGELEKIAVIFLGTFFQVASAVSGAVRETPREYVDIARTVGLSERAILWHVILPSSWPAIIDILRISFGWAWSYLVVAEIVSTGSGIGYRVMWSQRYLQVGLVFVGLAELALLGIISDLLFRSLRRFLAPWQIA